MSTKPEECVNYLAPFRAGTKEQEPRYQIVELGFSDGFSPKPTHQQCSRYIQEKNRMLSLVVVYTVSVLVAPPNIWLIWSLGFNIQRYLAISSSGPAPPKFHLCHMHHHAGLETPN